MSLLFFGLIGLSLSSCLTELEPKDFPSSITCFEVNVANNQVDGELVQLGRNITEHGHCWSKTNPPSILNSRTNFGPVTEAIRFTSVMIPIDTLEQHYYAAYSLDELGDIFYSEVKSYRPR